MSGQVVIVHRPTSAAAAPSAPGATYRLAAERVMADMEPVVSSPGAAASGANAAVKRVTAEDGVTFQSQRIQFSARQVVYDPSQQTFVARGSDTTPVQVIDAAGLSTGSCRDLHYDLKTDQFRTTDFRAAVRR
jgi:hypothetical protein